MHPQVGGHAVGDLEPDAVVVGFIGEDVDEPGGHHQAARVDVLAAGQGPIGVGDDGGDGSAVYSHVGGPVEARVGVDHPASGDGQVIGVVRWWWVGGVGQGGGCHGLAHLYGRGGGRPSGCGPGGGQRGRHLAQDRPGSRAEAAGHEQATAGDAPR